MGKAGVAAASSISQWMGALLSVWRVHRRIGFTTGLRLADAKRLTRMGVDLFIRTGTPTLFLLLATRTATRIGPEAGAANQAIRQVWVFTALFLDASAIAAQSLIADVRLAVAGQNIAGGGGALGVAANGSANPGSYGFLDYRGSGAYLSAASVAGVSPMDIGALDLWSPG